MNKKHILTGILAVSVVATAMAATLSSGLGVGDAVYPFAPTHVTGPDKGTETCPVCKYGGLPAVQVWVNGDSLKNVTAIAKTINAKAASSKFKAFVVFLINPKDSEQTAKTLADVAEKNKLQNVALTWLDKNSESVTTYKVNTDSQVKNTVLVYKNRKVTTKFVNFQADKQGLKQLDAAVAQITQ
jgi:protocatechuate 3,4-dioxygenase, beta subunit